MSWIFRRWTGLQCAALPIFVACFLFVPSMGDAATSSAKLRVFVQPVSGSPEKGVWQVPDTVFARQQYVVTERILTQKGAYEVVPEAEARDFLRGETYPAWRWQRNDWALAKETGKGLGADYAMIVERGFYGFRYWRMVLINLDSGRLFDVREEMPTGPGGGPERFRQLARESYRKIFSAAKGDMLTTALRKGRALTVPASTPSPSGTSLPAESSKGPGMQAARPPAVERGTTAAPTVVAERTPAVSPERPRKPSGAGGRIGGQRGGPATGGSRTEGPDTSLRPPETPIGGKMRLIVHDFEAGADLDVAGMILAEALREELHRLGRFTLINREDMVRALEEQKLKMVGLVAEEGSAEIGKWLMASEMVTGKLSRLGKTSILQTKRTDIESLRVRNLRSLKASFGKEEELLDGIPELARRLFESP